MTSSNGLKSAVSKQGCGEQEFDGHGYLRCGEYKYLCKKCKNLAKAKGENKMVKEQKVFETLTDLKRHLNKIPDKVLDEFFVANTDDGWALSVSEDRDEGASEYFIKMGKKYKSLAILSAYFDRLIEGTKDEDGDFIWIDENKEVSSVSSQD
jgi:hypothetical protein